MNYYLILLQRQSFFLVSVVPSFLRQKDRWVRQGQLARIHPQQILGEIVSQGKVFYKHHHVVWVGMLSQAGSDFSIILK